MPILATHGSACCGARCLQGFGVPTTESKKQLDEAIAVEQRRRRCGFIELIITDSQVLNWHEELVKRGFERIIRFYNSGNSMCNVYVLISGQKNLAGEKDDPVPKIKTTTDKKVKDVTSPFAKKAAEPLPPATRQGARAAPVGRITSLAGRRVRELGLNVADIQGTGPGGQILLRDVNAAAQRR